MAETGTIVTSAQGVSAQISEFAIKLRQIHDELNSRIDQNSTASLWIGETPPTDLYRYNGWVKTTQTDVDLLYNQGTVTTPDWQSVLRTTHRPTTMGTPFKTSERVGTRIVWAVDIDVGYLPATTLKMVPLPTTVTSVWGSLSERWLDVANCSAYNPGTDTVIPLPFNTMVAGDPDVLQWTSGVSYQIGDYVLRLGRAYRAQSSNNNQTPESKSGAGQPWEDLGPSETAAVPRKMNKDDLVDIYLKGTSVFVKTTANRADFIGKVRVKYLTV